jgi:hypothetical protein
MSAKFLSMDERVAAVERVRDNQVNLASRKMFLLSHELTIGYSSYDLLAERSREQAFQEA